MTPFIVTEQLPFKRIQTAELRETDPAPEGDQVTAPVGELPFTVALHAVTEPEITEAGLQDTVRVVGAGRPAVFVMVEVTLVVSARASQAF